MFLSFFVVTKPCLLFVFLHYYCIECVHAFAPIMGKSGNYVHCTDITE
jgi:hypothetical protein